MKIKGEFPGHKWVRISAIEILEAFRVHLDARF